MIEKLGTVFTVIEVIENDGSVQKESGQSGYRRMESVVESFFWFRAELIHISGGAGCQLGMIVMLPGAAGMLKAFALAGTLDVAPEDLDGISRKFFRSSQTIDFASELIRNFDNGRWATLVAP